MAFSEGTGYEPWRSDGTRYGTGPLDVAPGSVSSGERDSFSFIATTSHVFFPADDGRTGRELHAFPLAGSSRRCPGDCDRNLRVSVGELIVGVGMSVGEIAADECVAFDIDDSGDVEIHELVAAVRSSLHECDERPADSATG